MTIRELSPQVQTRWYRAPEVILTEETYGKLADIWSIGVIMSELLSISQEQKSPPNRFLFKGKTCYPISPANKNASRG